MVDHNYPHLLQQAASMTSIDEQILRATKEIIVKFIEVGRVSPTSFDESFKTVYQTIYESVKQTEQQSPKK